jgi:hypothetical protein
MSLQADTSAEKEFAVIGGLRGHLGLGGRGEPKSSTDNRGCGGCQISPFHYYSPSVDVCWAMTPEFHYWRYTF